MDSFVSCFDIVLMVVDEATSQASASLKVDNSKCEVFKIICDIIDKITDDIDCKSLDVEVDENMTTISISVECVEFSADLKKKMYCNLIRISNSFNISVSKNGYLNMRFVFPGVWTNV